MINRSSLRRLALSSGLRSAGVLPALVPLALAAVVSLPASAQLAGKGVINGRVVDASGAVVPDAVVTITNNATNTKQTVKSTGAGEYSFSLDPGKYTLTVTREGFKGFTQQNITADALQTFSVDATLQTGDTSETITVTDAPPVLETSNASLGVTLENEQYAALPLIEDGGGQRRATDFAQYLPGVSSQTTNGNLTTNAGIVNGGGSKGAVSSIYINGVPITSVAGEGDPRFVWTSIPVEAINQFQVQTVGYSAIYEGQGVQNYIVKSGTNKLHGSLYDYYRDTGLDTWGFQKATNPVTGLPQKPSEHQHNYGLFLGFPIIKDKLFVFGGYEGYRFRRQVPYQQEFIPTLLQRQGNFSESVSNANLCSGSYTTAQSSAAQTALSGCIYDPDTTTNVGGAYNRTAFAGNIIPVARQSAAARKLESYLPAPNIATTSVNQANYLVNYRTGLNNWSTSNRIDYTISPRQTVSAVIAFGRQATTAPAAVTVSNTTNGAPPPYISTQQFTPKTKVLLFEHDFTISNSLVNQLKFGYGRYDGPGYNQDIGGTFGAAANGITGLPAGQAQDSFPTVTFTGNTNINRWAGYSSNRPVASGYVLVDNLAWNVGKHAFTFGAEIAWMQYNYLVNATGVNPLQLTFSNGATNQYYRGSTTSVTTTGNAYASFIAGAVNAGSFTYSVVPETGARFRPISPYVQDNWKILPNLTLDIGVRYDYYPSYREVKNRFAYFDPNATNPLINAKGAVAFGGNGAGLGTGSGFCNCDKPVNDYFKHFSPRIGFAYTPNPTTVIRGSYSILYTHGNANGGSATSRQGSGLEGFSVTPSTTFNNPAAGQVGNSYWRLDSPYPAYTLPPNFDPAIGTYYTSLSTQALQNPTYADPYYGGRAPQFINYSFGIQQQFGADTTFTLSYVGSQGHFLTPDALTARGQYSNQLDPKYLYLGSLLGSTANATNRIAAGNLALPYASFGGTANPTIQQMLKPFAQYSSISDAYGFVGNSRYQALQAYMTKRLSHGLTFMTNYTWSHTIDNNGYFRAGYDIPAQFASDGRFHAARSLDKSNSLGDQRHKFVVTGAYDLPFGKGMLGGTNEVTRTIFGGFRLSTIFTAYSGQPLSVVMNSPNVNPAQNSNDAVPLMNPNYGGNGRIAGLSRPQTTNDLGKTQYLDPNAFLKPADYTFATTARTAAYSGLYQPGNYRLDASLRRSFAIPTGGLHEGTKLAIEADYFNVTNHTHFVYSQSNAVLNNWGTSSYGTMQVDSTVPINRALQLAARIEF